MALAQDKKASVRQVVEQLFGAIAISSSGDNTIVAAIANSYIRVIRYELVVNGAVIITWKSSIAGALSGGMSFATNGGISTPECPAGIVQTAKGEALVINLGGAVSVGGSLTYVVMTDL